MLSNCPSSACVAQRAPRLQLLPTLRLPAPRGPFSRPFTAINSVRTHHAPWGSSRTSSTTVTSEVIEEVSAAQQLLDKVEAHCNTPQTKGLMIIMFTADWCGPCKLVKKQLAKLTALRKPGTLSVVSADVDKMKDLSSSLGITSLPTLVFVGHDPSKPSICTVGPVSAPLIADVLDSKGHLCGADLKTRLRLS